jgi:hypothetical protein
MEDIQSQLSQLTMNAQDTQHPSTEYTTTQAVSEETLATNWIRLFDYNYPNQTHVLDPYRESNQRMISFIRSWFTFKEPNTFQYLDDLANDPHLGELNGSVGNGEASATELECPDKAYVSFEDWYGDLDKPQGWIFNEQTQRLVPFTYWLEGKDMVTKNSEQKDSTEDDRFKNEDTDQDDAGLSVQLGHMQIDETDADLSFQLEHMKIDAMMED